jgi:hypothetical protein
MYIVKKPNEKYVSFLTGVNVVLNVSCDFCLLFYQESRSIDLKMLKKQVKKTYNQDHFTSVAAASSRLHCHYIRYDFQ